MPRVLVNRVNIQAKLAEGYTFVAGNGPDGRAWVGDAVLMEISDARYEQLTKQRREAYELLQRALREGSLPVESNEPGIVVKHQAEDGRRVAQRRKELLDVSEK